MHVCASLCAAECISVYLCLFQCLLQHAGDLWVISVIGSPPCHLVLVFVDRPCFNLAFVSNLQ